MLRTLIFDWDGTLHNTARLYGCAFRSAYRFLVTNGYAPDRVYSDEELSVYLGMNAPDMWNTFMTELPNNIKRLASDMVGKNMVKAIQAGKAVLYPGTEEILDILKQTGFQMVILSNCKHDYMQAHRAAFGLDRWFDAYYCCEDYNFAPKEEIFPFIQENYPGQFAVIGDRSSDFKTAQVHKLFSVGCAYGFGCAEELSNASCIVGNITEIPKVIERAKNNIA